MYRFQLVSEYKPSGDQPAAIDALAKGVELGLREQTLLGVTGSGKTFTMASIIEKETAYSGESKNIASVIYNRLTNPGEYPKLNIDATIVYALGGKTDLTAEDMAFDSPYNTYLYEGLPPGAISNPGLYSLKAALYPAQTKYHFYALDTSGEANVHRFFETYSEHLDFIQGRG